MKPQHLLPVVFVSRMNAFFSVREFIELIHITFRSGGMIEANVVLSVCEAVGLRHL